MNNKERNEKTIKLLNNINVLNEDRIKRNKQELNPACLIAQLVSLAYIQQSHKPR